ncbi:MAG: hypothetical protein OEO79_08165 [Gemmatimonadota bacterium]|nr:hypothetical protein [Gemmatimonadota bacterium]MDH3421817.1 hypothetical protein [Gemmatimonadota bacterium]
METPTLVVSDPPHGDVDVDAAATLLGLDAAGTRLKVSFPAPEILSASEAGEAAEFAASLRGAGLTVSVLDGARLGGLPWPNLVSSLAFDQDGLTADLRDGSVHLPYESEVVAVYCKPPADFVMRSSVNAADAQARRDGPAIAEAIQWMANLDLYFTEAGVLRRVSIVRELTDFSSLGALRGSTSTESMAAVVQECRSRFGRLRFDARHENVRPRHKFVMGEAGFDPDQRKRYSFGTLLLCHILDSISPELRDVPQFELASRLCYVLCTRGIRAQ